MKNRETTERLVLNVPEAGNLLGISRATAYSLAAQGVIPTIRFGKRILVPKAALEKLLAETGNRNAHEQDLTFQARNRHEKEG